MKVSTIYTRLFSLFILSVLGLNVALAQIESTPLKEFDYLYRNVTYIEDFDDDEILFEKPKLIGPSGDMMISGGEAKLNTNEKGDGLLFTAKTTPGIMDKEAIEFEIRFKMASIFLPYRGIFELGQKMRGQAPLKIDINEVRAVCIHKTDIGVVEIKGSIKEIYKKDDYNTVTLLRYENRVMLFMNGTMIGQSKYSKKAEYAYNKKNVSDLKHDIRLKFIHPIGSIDYVKVSELTKEAPVQLAQQVETQRTPTTTPVNNNSTSDSRDTGFNFAGTNEKPNNNNTTNIDVAGKYYAIIIGNNEYEDPTIATLDQPIKDASKLYNVLTKEYTFDEKNVLFLKNANRTKIIEAFDALSNNLTPNDNLLIFYAGHGYWNEEKETGYWLPVDAKKSNTANWLRNSTIQGYLDEIPAKHTLLIADACFGGGIFKTRKAFNDAPPSIESLYKLKSRKGITSGMLNEVPDRSVFMEYLTKRLIENELKYISTLDVFTQFRVAVMNNSNNTPQYGTIHNTGDEGGDFIFIKRTK